MDIVTVALKFIMYSVLGYYIMFFIFLSRKKIFDGYFKGIICPSLGLFGLLAVFCPYNNVVYIFLEGLIGGLILHTLVNMYTKVHYKLYLFGILNLVNYYFIEKLFNWFLENSSMSSQTFLLIFSGILFITDVIYTLRAKT